MSDVEVLREEARYTLEELARKIEQPLREAGVVRAVAFGSYARGEADGYADLDLVVVLPTDRPRLERGQLLGKVVNALPVAVDLVILTPEEFERGSERGLGIFDALVREGVTIYG